MTYHIVIQTRTGHSVDLYGAPFSILEALRDGVKSEWTTTEVIHEDDWHIFVNKHILNISAYRETA